MQKQYKFDPKFNKLRYGWSNKSPDFIFSRLKHHYGSSEILKYTNRLTEEPAFRNNFFKGSIQKSISEYTQPFLLQGDLKQELIWAANKLRFFHKELNLFLGYRDRISKLILNEDFEGALSALEESCKKLGHSFWYLEVKIALLELVGGLEEQKRFRKQIMDTQNKDPFINFLVHWYSLRSEEKNSLDRFMKELNATTIEYPFIKDFANFKFNFFNNPRYEDMSSILYFESSSSVFDIYLTFVRVIQLILSTFNFNSEEFKISREAIKVLGAGIEDFNLTNINHLLGDFPYVNANESHPLFLIDKYTIGKYGDVVTKNVIESRSVPLNIQVLAIARSAPMESLMSNETMDYKLANIILRLDKSENYRADIIKLCTRFSSFDWVSSVVPFLKSKNLFGHLRLHEWNEKIATINSFCSNPKLAELMPEEDRRKGFLKAIESAFPKSETLAVLKLDSESIENIDSFKSVGVDDVRSVRLYAKYLYKKGNFQAANNVIEEILTPGQRDIDRLSFVELRTLLSLCSVRLKKLEVALNICIEDIVANDRNYEIYPLFNFYTWLKMLQTQDPRIIVEKAMAYDLIIRNSQMDLAIYKYAEVSRLLKNQGVRHPSELKIDNLKIKNRDLLIYFLHKICTLDCLDFQAGVYKEPAEAENERLNILKLLIQLDPSKEKIFSDEMLELSKRQIIRKRTSEIEASKIFVDVDNIKKTSEKKLKEDFDRYRALIAFENKFGITDLDYLAKVLEILKSKKDTSLLLLDLPKRESQKAFERILFDIRDKFISGEKYGLDCYVSAGIRHGTLAGQVRKNLGSNSVISKKNLNEEYAMDEMWLEKYANNGVEYTSRLNDELSGFSLNIDQLIKNTTNKVLNISHKLKPEQYFDYYLPESETSELFDDLLAEESFEKFFSKVIDFLWSKTEDNLKKVRAYFEGTFKSEISSYLAELIVSLNAITPQPKELIASVNTARTSTLDEIDKITHWFRISSDNIKEDLSIATIVDLTKGQVTSYYPKFRLSLTENIEQSVIVKGKFVNDFYYLFFNTFENICKHSGDVNIEAQIDIKKTSKGLNILIENTIGAGIDVESLATKVNDKMIELEKDEEISKKVSKEGGSGFFKIKKILDIDLGSKNCLKIRVDKKTKKFVVSIDSVNEGVLCE